jgi:hypothetical protein
MQGFPQGLDKRGERGIILVSKIAAASTCQRLPRIELDRGRAATCHERRTAMHSALKACQVVSYFWSVA